MTAAVSGASSAGAPRTAWADPDGAPLAGERYATSLFGHEVEAPARNRRSVTALDLGVVLPAPAPRENSFTPYGALYMYRAAEDDTRRFRAVIAGLYNDIKYHDGVLLPGPTELVLGVENLWIPIDRSEVVGGLRVREEELQEGRVHFKIGLGWRVPIEPGFSDNAFLAAVTYEPGYLFFKKGSDAHGGFVRPANTSEHAVRLRLSWDALVRNLLEMPHRGFACGTEVVGRFRGRHWRDWGVLAVHSGGKTRESVAWCGYLHAALPMPLAADRRRNRLVGSLHFALSEDVDRFSAPRLGGGPSGGEYEALSLPLLPGALINEFYAGRHAVAALEYRRELLFFMFAHLRVTGACVRRHHRSVRGIRQRTDLMSAGTLGLTSGAPWNSMIRVCYSYSPDIIRKGRHGGHEVLLGWSTEF